MAPLLFVLLLLCVPSHCLHQTTAPAPAPATATGLQAEEACLGVGTDGVASACMGAVALACLATGAFTDEASFLPCFFAGLLSEQCFAGAPKAEEHCLGIAFSEERKRCIGLIGWSCRNSSFGYPGFMLCFLNGYTHCMSM